MKMRKKTFAITVFSISFLAILFISAFALWENDVIFNRPAEPVVQPEVAVDTNIYPAPADDGRWGYINNKGEMVVAAEYAAADFFFGDIAWVQKDGMWGAIDKNGAPVIDFIYPEKSRLDDGTRGLVAVFLNNVSSLYDKDGNKLFGVEGQLGELDGGLIAFSRVKDGAKLWGFVDTTGNIVVPPLYKEVGAVGSTHALAKNFDDQMLLISRKDASELILTEPVEPEALGSDRLLVGDEQGWGYLDTQGELVIERQYLEAYPFANGAAVAAVASGFGLIDAEGSWIIEPTYAAGEYIGNRYYAFTNDNLQKTIFDTEGNVIAEGVWTVGEWLEGKLAIQTAGQTRFLLNKQGVLTEPVLANRYNLGYIGNLLCAFDDNGVSYYDLAGNTVYSMGQILYLSEDYQLKTRFENADACFQIYYPEIVQATGGSMHHAYENINERLWENACGYYEHLYKNPDGSVNFIVQGQFETVRAGSIVSVLQKNLVLDRETAPAYASVCFEQGSGQQFEPSALFRKTVNWRSDLSEPLITSYTEACRIDGSEPSADVLTALERRLDRETPFALTADRIEFYILAGDYYTKVALTYDAIADMINTDGVLWRYLQPTPTVE